MLLETKISNHPNFANIVRYIDLDISNPNDLVLSQFETKSTTKNTVRHYLGSKSDANYIKELDKLITLVADNTAQIPDGKGGTVGDYDYMIAKVKSDVGLVTIYAELMGYLDSIGKINAKCNY